MAIGNSLLVGRCPASQVCDGSMPPDGKSIAYYDFEEMLKRKKPCIRGNSDAAVTVRERQAR